MIPDSQRIVADFLRENGIRAAVKPPSSTKTSWVMVTEIAAPQMPGSPADAIVTFIMQLDCYAGEDVRGEIHGAPEANDLCRTVRDLLQALPQEEIADADVSAVRVTNQFPQRDEDYKPARDRWILDIAMTARSLEPAS